LALRDYKDLIRLKPAETEKRFGEPLPETVTRDARLSPTTTDATREHDQQKRISTKREKPVSKSLLRRRGYEKTGKRRLLSSAKRFAIP